MTRPHFNRILLKLSGEALIGQGQFGIDPAAVDGLASEIAAAKAQGHAAIVGRVEGVRRRRGPP